MPLTFRCINSLPFIDLVTFMQSTGINPADYWAVGGGYFNTFLSKRGAFTGTDEKGLDRSVMALQNGVFDPTLDAVFGDGLSHLILVPRETIMPYEWYRYVGNSEVLPAQTGDSKHLRTRREFGGMGYDYSFRRRLCDENDWTVGLQKVYDFCTPPDDVFCNGNGIIHFTLSCGDYSCTTTNELTALACRSGF